MKTMTTHVDRVAYERVHTSLGFYDASKTYGRIIGEGRDVIDLLHRMSTNDLKTIEGKPGSATQTVLTNEKARIVGVLTVLGRTRDTFIVTSAHREPNVISWLDRFTIMEDARFRRCSYTVAQFIVCGPRALDFFREYTSEDLISMPSMNWISVEIGGCPVTLQKSFRIAESGWQIFVDGENATEVKRLLEARVLELGGATIDDELFNTLRIESGIPLAPSELNEKHNPLETTLVSAVNFKKGCYIGQEVIARLDSYDKVQRHMMGLVFTGLAADVESELGSAVSARTQETIVDFMAEELGGEMGYTLYEFPAFKVTLAGDPATEIGELSSVALSPGMDRMIGLAFVRSAHSNPELPVAVRLNEQTVLAAKLVKLPFDV